MIIIAQIELLVKKLGINIVSIFVKKSLNSEVLMINKILINLRRLVSNVGAAALVFTALQSASATTITGVKVNNRTETTSFGQPIYLPIAEPVSVEDSVSDIEAARLANQASFGASDALIKEIKSKGAQLWIADQFSSPASQYSSMEKKEIHTVFSRDGWYCYVLTGIVDPWSCNRDWYSSAPVKRDFFVQATTAQDQLRMRVAHLLSQIFVVSATDFNGLDNKGTYGLARFQQSLRNLAFSNYRHVLRSVTIDPVMGEYLDMLNNSKNNPNENYARELLQLFSVGTCLLNPDGSLVSGTCRPLFNNDTVREYAYALTGWTYSPGGIQLPGSFKPDWANHRYLGASMVPVISQHDQNPRTLLSGVVVPASRTPEQALEAVLDSIMNHPNTAPFVSVRFIRNFVTSNPSPQYVARVANAFNTGKFGSIGTGVRGDLSATIAAVLLDNEARDLITAKQPHFGKLREPVLMMTGLIRALNGYTDGQYLGKPHYGSGLEQPLFNSPTVFNYYFLDGTLSERADIAAPEFTITNSNATAGRISFVQDIIFDWNTSWQVAFVGGLPPDPGWPGSIGTFIRWGTFHHLTQNPTDLVNRLSVLLTAGFLTAAEKAQVVRYLPTFPQPVADVDKTSIVRHAVYAIATSPQFHIQR